MWTNLSGSYRGFGRIHIPRPRHLEASDRESNSKPNGSHAISHHESAHTHTLRFPDTLSHAHPQCIPNNSVCGSSREALPGRLHAQCQLARAWTLLPRAYCDMQARRSGQYQIRRRFYGGATSALSPPWLPGSSAYSIAHHCPAHCPANSLAGIMDFVPRRLPDEQYPPSVTHLQ